MSDHFEQTEETPRVPGSRMSVSIAWLIIVLACGWVVWEANRIPVAEDGTAEQQELSLASELTVKMMIGLAEWSPEARDMIVEQARALDRDGVPGQLARSVLTAEMQGLEQARKELDVADDQLADLSDGETANTLSEVAEILDRLYADDTPVNLSEEDRALLVERLGWVGRLAPLVQPLAEGSSEREQLIKPLRRMPLVMMGFLVWMAVCLLGGVAALITLLVLALLRRLHHGFAPVGHGGAIYAEIFAVWTLLFIGVKFIAGALELTGIAVTLFGTIGGLVLALAWGLVRGVSWRRMRQDVGLHFGRGFVVETLSGVVTYCMAIPILGVALMMTLALMALQEYLTPNAPPPSHPVQQFVAEGNWVVIVQTMFLAAVVAPVVEEIIFRGALYRHLREGTNTWGPLASMTVSAAISSVIFAAIHPQGWPFIPVLASLAVAFCLAREWRGSLWPCIVAHGMNNFVIMTLNVLLLAP